jgi:predicted ATP-dependent endonuclease of OLD family
MKITKFGLSNFRIFKEHFEFELAPLMVLTGPNDSGKSSLSKALLLLKENEDRIDDYPNYNARLNYFKGEHDLGNHSFTINLKGENTNFTFTFFLDYKVVIRINNEGECIRDYLIVNEDNELIIDQDWCDIKINVRNIIHYFLERFTSIKSNRKSYPKISNYQLNRIEKFIYKLIDFGEKFRSIDIDIFHCPFNREELPKNESTADENLKDGIFNSVFRIDYQLKNMDWSHWDEGCQGSLILLFYEITKIELTSADLDLLIPTSKSGYFSFDDLIYVNTIKEPLKRAYGKNDSSVFQSLINREIIKNLKEDEITYRFREKIIEKDIDDSKKFNLRENESYNSFINKWLNKFDIGEELSYGYDEENDIFYVKIDNKSLPEHGLGFGLIIHILLALNNEVNNSNRHFQENSKTDFKLHFPPTYIIEEPETGLHPAYQSKMAEMIVDILKTFNVNLIIETHSEYFIRKLQYLTAINEIKPGDAIIYYFNNPKKVPENEEQIKKITIAKDGSLSDNFGTGFIDEGTNLKFELLRLAKGQQN